NPDHMPNSPEPEDFTPVVAVASRAQLVSDLNAAHRARVDLQKELATKSKEMERQKHLHSEKMLKLEKELDSSVREGTRLKVDLDESVATRDKMKEEYERKLKLLDSQINKVKAKLKEQEKSAKDKEQSDRKVQEYQQELDKLNLAIANAKKKAKEDADKIAEVDARRTKEVAALNRAREEDGKKIRQLEVAAEMIRKKLDRKNEELVLLSKKLKDFAIEKSNAPKSSKSERGRSLPRKDHSPVRRNASADPAYRPKIQETIDIVTVQDPVEPQESHSGEIEVFKKYHSISVALRELRSNLESIGAELQDQENIVYNPDADPAESEVAKLRAEELKKERKTIARRIVELRQERKAVEAQLSNPEKSTEITVSADFKPAEVDDFNYAELNQEFEDDQDALEKQKKANLKDTRNMVIGCLRELADLRNLEKNHAKDSDDAQTEARKLVRAYEKKLSKVQQNYERKLQDAQIQLASATAPARFKELEDRECQTESWEKAHETAVVNLERDLFYYKQTNKELKAKLREIVAVNHKLSKSRQGERVSSSRRNEPEETIENNMPIASVESMDVHCPPPQNQIAPAAL
ncbi:hypothetical protein HDU76_003132, partial [Blyttiomyces sp. JEL0837]